MSYISEMRALVGTRPLVVVGAGALIRDAGGRLLMQRRSDDGLWGIPGGGLEVGESVEAAACREVFEETGLVLHDLTLFGVFSGPDSCHTYPNGDRAAIVSVVFRAGRAEGEPRARDGESLELRYITPDELRRLPISPPNRPIISGFLESLT